MIYHILGEKNGKVDILSKKNNYIESKKIFNYSIFKVNRDK